MSGKTHFFVVPAALLMLLPVVAPSAPGDSNIEAPRGIVDCLLPGAMRRIGGNYYQLPQRPARITASECTIRGGDFLLYDRANYETSLKFWITQAERGSGDADAMYYVGEIYEQGIGRDPDYAAAASWYGQAADAGNTTAMISLAHLHKTGKGVPLDLEMAQALYSQAFGSDIPLPLDPTAVKGADQRVETLIAEVDEVRRQKIAVEHELRAASEQLANARHALEDALGGSEAHSELIRDLRASIAKQEAEITAYQTNLQGMQAENAELKILRQQLEEQKIETARLGSLLAIAERKVEHRQTQLANQQEALDSKQAEFDDHLANAALDREALQAISRELEKYREEIKTLEATLRKAEEERNLYQALASDAATQEDRVATLTARITVLDHQSSSVESESEALRRDLAAARNQLDEKIAVASAAEQASDAEIAAREAEIQRLRAAVRRTEQETDRHRSDIDRLSQQSAELERLRGALEREQAQANRLQQLLTESQDRFAESNARLVQINAARAALDEEIAELRAGAAAGDQASQVLLQQRESELRSSRDELQALQAQIAASEDEFGRYQQQMADTATRQRHAIEDLRVAVAASRAEREQLEEQLASASQQLGSARTDLELEQQRYTKLQDRLREARAQSTASSEALAEKQRKLDGQSQQVASLQQEINRLNQQSNRYAAEITALKDRAQAKKVEFVGPRIVMLEPSESLLADSGLAAGGDALTRGISVVIATRLSETKIIRGHVEAPAGLAQLTIDGLEIAFDKNNSFTQALKLDSESRDVRIVALDHNGKQDVKEFRYRIDGTVGQAANIHNKAARFEQARNDALDHLRYYALIIANEEYENDFLRDLETPISDAEAIGAVLEDRYHFQVDILRNATKDMIEAELERIFYVEENDDNEENDKDAILIYYAGHGFPSDSRTKDAYFWAPVDAESGSPRTWFKTRELESYMQVSSINQIMVVADSCFAGNVLSRDGMSGQFASLKARNWRRFLTEYTEKKKSRFVLTAGAFAPVLDGGGGGNHSVFARAFLDVLLANNEIISATKIYEQVAPIVMALAERQDHSQTPLFGYLASAGHEFGNFYLPAPLQMSQTTGSIDRINLITTTAIVAQVDQTLQ